MNKYLILILIANSINLAAKKELPAPVVTIPFDTETGWLLIPVTIMDSTYQFIFDTGTYFSSWHASPKSDPLELPFVKKLVKEIPVVTGDGETLKEGYYLTNYSFFSIEGVQWLAPIIGIGNRPSMLKKHQNISGILGIFDICRFYWLFDFKEKVVHLSRDPISFDQTAHQKQLIFPLKFSLPIFNPRKALPKVKLQVAGKKNIQFIFDTGNVSHGLCHITLNPLEWNRLPSSLSHELMHLTPDDDYSIRTIDSLQINKQMFYKQKVQIVDSESDSFTVDFLKDSKIAGSIGLDFCMQFSKMYYDKKKDTVILLE